MQNKYVVDFAVGGDNVSVEVTSHNVPDARKKAWGQLIAERGQLVSTHSNLLNVEKAGSVEFGFPFPFLFTNEKLHINHEKDFFGEDPDDAYMKAEQWADIHLNPEWSISPVSLA